MVLPSIVVLNIDSFKFNFAQEIFLKISKSPSDFPIWNNFIKDFVFFNNIISAAPYTVASDNSLITGLYPLSHGKSSWLRQTFESIPKNTPTLQWVLRSIGYQTFYYSDNLTRIEVIPWNFDFYEQNTTEYMLEKISSNLSNSPNKPSFYFLKFNNIHDEVCAKNGETNQKDYSRICFETLKKLEDIVLFLSNNSDKFTTYITTDHGTTLSDEAQGRYIEKITGNYLSNKTIRTFFIYKQKNRLIKDQVEKSKDKILINNNLFSNIDIFSTILNDISITTNISESNLIDGLKRKKRLLSIGGGLLQSPYKPSSFSITTSKNRFICYKRNILGFNDYFYELFNLSSDPYQISNLWETLTLKNKSIIQKSFKIYFSKEHNKKNNKLFEFYLKNKKHKLKKNYLSKSGRYWIIYSRLVSVYIFFKIFQARAKDRLIYVLRSGHHKLN